VQVSAAVFRNWPMDRDSIGQDWGMWCEQGWLDFVCPMDYVDSNASFRNIVSLQKAFAAKVPLYPGIGLSCWKDPHDAANSPSRLRSRANWDCRVYGFQLRRERGGGPALDAARRYGRPVVCKNSRRVFFPDRITGLT
jgi:hypothetical protein